jgi:hypothetical protein
MDYVSPWERLPDALDRVMATGRSREAAQNAICRAITDGAVQIRGKLGKHSTRRTTGNRVLEGKDFYIPAEIKPEDLNWEQSRPQEPWPIRREIYDVPGMWEVEWIELCRANVTAVLCTGLPGESGRPAPNETRATSTSRPPADDNSVDPSPRSSAPQSRGAAGSPRRRGAPPRKLEQTKAAMKDDIQQQRRSVPQLKAMLDKDLSATYGVSRDTARKALRAVLSEFGAD